jgi:uncharacterized spore protein YtfJ
MEVFPMASEIETAIAEAQRAGEGGPIEGFVARVADRIGAHATVKAVFGDPIERDGITVIPVAKVRWGFGGGAGGPIVGGTGAEAPDGGATTEAAAVATGSGGGGAVTADPVGWLEIGPDGAEFKPIVPPMPSPGFVLAAGATAALVLRGLARLLRR